MAVQRSRKFSWGVSIAFHAVLISLLFLSLEKTIFVAADPAPPTSQPIIDAVVVTPKALQQERARLQAIEDQKRELAEQREAAIEQKAKAAEEKRQQEESRLAELKQKSEQLKKEAQQQKLAQQKQVEEQQAKVKAEKAALQKLQAEKQKLEAERAAQAKQEPAPAPEAKTAEADQPAPSAPPSASAPVRQDQITQHGMKIRNKIQQNWRQPTGLDIAGFKCKVAVKLMPNGEVLDAQVIQSSGSLEFDRSAEVAVQKASPLPMPEDPALANKFRDFSFTFNPEAA